MLRHSGGGKIKPGQPPACSLLFLLYHILSEKSTAKAVAAPVFFRQLRRWNFSKIAAYVWSAVAVSADLIKRVAQFRCPIIV